jgi:hypothetical protein
VLGDDESAAALDADAAGGDAVGAVAEADVDGVGSALPAHPAARRVAPSASDSGNRQGVDPDRMPSIMPKDSSDVDLRIPDRSARTLAARSPDRRVVRTEVVWSWQPFPYIGLAPLRCSSAACYR